MRGVLRGPALALTGLLLLVCALGVRQLDREIKFYDEAVYVESARSLASGAGYRNPSLPGSPPQAKYPPGLSLLLSVAWRLVPAFPDNLIAMKALVLGSALATIVLTWSWLRIGRAIGPFDAIAVAALLGCSPLLLLFSTLVTSDVPYAFLSLAAVYLYERDARARSLYAVLGVAALAFLTRTAGLFLFAAIVLHLLIERRVGQAAVAALVATAVVLPWLAWSGWASAAYAGYPPGIRGNYVGYASAIPSASSLAHLPAIVTVNLRLLLGTWGAFVTPWASPRVAIVIVLGALGALLLVGRPRYPTLAALYCAVYVPSILLIPYPDTRYGLPIVPFLIAWTVGGLRVIGRGRPSGTLLIVVLVVAALATDVRHATRVHSDQTILTEFHATTDWMAATLPSDAILVGDWDAGYHLFAGRRAIRVSVNDNLKIYYADAVTTEFPEARELAAAFQRMGACYFVRDTIIGGREAVFFSRLLDAVEAAAPAPFEQIYASATGQFVVRRRTDCPSPG